MQVQSVDMLISPVIVPITLTDNTAQVGAIIDRANFENLTFAIATGNMADADVTLTVLVEEGDASDLSDNAAVADADLIGTEALAGFINTEDSTVKKIGYAGSKRYVRLTVTPASNTGSLPLAAVAIQTNPKKGGLTTQAVS